MKRITKDVIVVRRPAGSPDKVIAVIQPRRASRAETLPPPIRRRRNTK